MSDLINMMELSRLMGIESSSLVRISHQDPNFPPVIVRSKSSGHAFYFDREQIEAWYAQQPIKRIDFLCVRQFLKLPQFAHLLKDDDEDENQEDASDE